MVSFEPKPAIDQLFDDVSQTFWIVFFFYVIVSFFWILYCFYIHKMELRLVEKKIEANGVARTLELQRLLDAYNRVTTSSDPSSSTSSPGIEEQV